MVLLAAGRSRRALLIGAAALAVSYGIACAAEPVRIPDPPPGKAIIVFYRTWIYPAAAVSYTVREGAHALGRLQSGTYFVIVAEPGLHTFTVRSERHNNMQLVVDPDEIYYVRFELANGILLWQPDLTPSEQRLFDEASGKLRPTMAFGAAAEPTPSDQEKRPGIAPGP